MAAIMLSGEKDKYLFSVVDKNTALPPVAGFYILIKSDDKYGIRDREFLAIGYSEDFNREKAGIVSKAKNCSHLYIMPDFERDPAEVLHDIEKASFLNKDFDKQAEETARV